MWMWLGDRILWCTHRLSYGSVCCGDTNS